MNMNRRTFIRGLGLTAATLPIALSNPFAPSNPVRIRFNQFPKTAAEPRFSESDQALLGFLQPKVGNLHLLGGPILPLLHGTPPPWISLLVDSHSFRDLKQQLFEFGVDPISTPHMPGSFIKFTFAGQIYNIVNGKVDNLCQRHAVLLEHKLIPFAHSFLILDVLRSELYDPYQAALARASGGRLQIRLLRQPRTLLDAFDYLLSSLLECSLLQLERSPELFALEPFVLRAEPNKEEQRRVTERFVNYFPDLVDLHGYDSARRLLLSRFIGESLRNSMRIDPGDLDVRLNGIARQNGKVRDVDVLATLNDCLGYRPNEQHFTHNIDHYMLANAFQIRRTDLLRQLA